MELSVPDICDEHFDLLQVLPPVFTDYGKRRIFSGEVVTVKCFEDNSIVKELVGTPGHGRVIVVDGGGSLRRALLGDMLAAKAADSGWSGLVIHGCVRDVEILKTIDLGVRALRPIPVKTDKRGEGQLNVAIDIAGARVEPGQFLYADANGIVVAQHDLGVSLPGENG